MYRKTGIFKRNASILHSSVTGEIMDMQRAVCHMFIDFNQACDSERNVLTESGISVRLGRQLKYFLKENYNELHIGKYFSDTTLEGPCIIFVIYI